MTRPPPSAHASGTVGCEVEVLVLGDLNPDLVLRGDVAPRFGQAEQLLDSAELVIGGSGGITAHALARLGVPVRLLADVGDDVFGRDLTTRLANDGVDTSSVGTSALPTGLSVILSDGAERATLTLVGAIDAPPPPWRSPADLPAARHLHVASFYLQPRRAAVLPTLLLLARAAGLSTSLDTNFDPARSFDGLRDVLPHVDYLLPNRTELLGIAAALSVDDTTDLLEAARRVTAFGPTVVVKDGADGAVLVRPDGSHHHEPGGRSALVDTTGAGDSFNAGFLAALLDGRDEETALRWACVVGSRATQYAGGTGGHPTRSELAAALSDLVDTTNHS
jgi:sugar/nucleoside kinase (ribokinase family)